MKYYNFAVVGNPISHSLSPVIFSEYIRDNQGYNYTRILCDNISEIEEIINTFKIKGLNITAPFKSDILYLADELSDEVLTLNVANTVIYAKDGVKAYNTDFYGVIEPLSKQNVPRDSKFLVLGGGGAATSVVFALKKKGFYDILIANRTKEKSIRIGELYDIGFTDLESIGEEEFEVIVNTIPVNSKVFEKLKLYKDTIVFDANYNNQPLKKAAAEKKCTYINGMEWLIGQGKKSYELMTGIKEGEISIKFGNKQRVLDKVRKISLIGPMGAWKSSVGKHLAKLLNYDFFDLDFLIEEKEKKSITEIFKENGEGYFRDIENEVLREIVKKDKFILATGGGIVKQPRNISILKNSCWNILLYASPEECKKRINIDKRPLLKEKDVLKVLKNIFEERKNKYFETSDLIINTQGKTSLGVAKLLYEDYSITFGV